MHLNFYCPMTGQSVFFVIKGVIMAEFCLDCLNKYYKDKKLTEKDVILGEDLCEECGERKPCVIRIKQKNDFPQ